MPETLGVGDRLVDRASALAGAAAQPLVAGAGDQQVRQRIGGEHSRRPLRRLAVRLDRAILEAVRLIESPQAREQVGGLREDRSAQVGVLDAVVEGAQRLENAQRAPHLAAGESDASRQQYRAGDLVVEGQDRRTACRPFQPGGRPAPTPDRGGPSRARSGPVAVRARGGGGRHCSACGGGSGAPGRRGSPPPRRPTARARAGPRASTTRAPPGDGRPPSSGSRPLADAARSWSARARAGRARPLVQPPPLPIGQRLVGRLAQQCVLPGEG